jgi:hypothetical protein
VLHLEDAQSAVIVEGVCDEMFPDGQLAGQLSEARFPRDATRFVFGPVT